MSECTCDLEPAFRAYPDGGDAEHSGWDVRDAEFTLVAICPDETRAKLVAEALNAYVDPALNCCAEHRRPR